MADDTIFDAIVDTMLAAPTKRRTRGCERPFSVEQVLAIVAYTAFTAISVVAFALYAASAAELAITLGTYGGFVLLVIMAYLYCVLVDVAAPGGFALPCMRPTQQNERWCRLCQKTIPGLDHHCNWLNTCVGTRTYWAFLILLVASTAQFLLQVLWAILVATVWGDDGDNGLGVGPYIYLGFVAAFGLAGLVSVGSLLLFHVYLLTQGIGTYDWLIRRLERTRARDARAAEVARNAAAAAAARTAGVVAVTVAPTAAGTSWFKRKSLPGSSAAQPTVVELPQVAGSGAGAGVGPGAGSRGSTASAAVAGAGAGPTAVVASSSAHPRQLSADRAWLGGAAFDTETGSRSVHHTAVAAAVAGGGGGGAGEGDEGGPTPDEGVSPYASIGSASGRTGSGGGSAGGGAAAAGRGGVGRLASNGTEAALGVRIDDNFEPVMGGYSANNSVNSAYNNNYGSVGAQVHLRTPVAAAAAPAEPTAAAAAVTGAAKAAAAAPASASASGPSGGGGPLARIGLRPTSGSAATTAGGLSRFGSATSGSNGSNSGGGGPASPQQVRVGGMSGGYGGKEEREEEEGKNGRESEAEGKDSDAKRGR